MLFRQLFDSPTSTYTYLIGDPTCNQAILVDPVLEQYERDLQLLRELNLNLVHTLETHIHADHVTSAAKLREVTGSHSVVPHQAQIACADRYVHHGDVITIGSITIEAIETLGHTNSHMAYLVNQTHVLTGDALFIRGCGRTDFQGGDAGQMFDGVMERLFTLPDETLVYPGHDYRGHTVSTIGEEKRLNPRFVGRDRHQFIEYMTNLNLPNPKKIMEAVPANQQCGQVNPTA